MTSPTSVPSRYHMFDRLYDIFRIHGFASRPTDIRYDSVTTEIIASNHNVDTGLNLYFRSIGRSFHDLISVSFPDINDHPVRFHRIAQQFPWNLKNIMGSEDQIHEPITLFSAFPLRELPASYKPAPSDHHMPVFSCLHAAKIIPDGRRHAVGIFSDGAVCNK